MGKRTCSGPDCSKPVKAVAANLCSGHAEQARRGLPLTPLRQYERGGICKLDGCDEPRSRGTTGSADYCPMHRMRVYKGGNVRGAERERAPAGEAVWDTPEYRRRYQRLKWYGLTPEKFDALLASQDGRCAICRCESPRGRRTGTWTVDHDHETGEVRGLLCNPCNRALGLFGDDPEILAAALRYVTK